jgi:hypothetical protein
MMLFLGGMVCQTLLLRPAEPNTIATTAPMARPQIPVMDVPTDGQSEVRAVEERRLSAALQETSQGKGAEHGPQALWHDSAQSAIVLPVTATGVYPQFSQRIKNMVTLLQLIGGLAGIGSLVCFILVLVKMFQNGQTGLGIACIVLVFLCGIGALVSFVYGWINADRWGIRNVMLFWTGCFVVGLVCNLLVISMVGLHGLGGAGVPIR